VLGRSDGLSFIRSAGRWFDQSVVWSVDWLVGGLVAGLVEGFQPRREHEGTFTPLKKPSNHFTGG